MAITRAELEALDHSDPLSRFHDEFTLPEGVIYLDGNSLGPLPRDTPGRLRAAVEQQWGEGLIRSWTEAGWLTLAGRIGDKIGRLIGAAPGRVMVADSTSVNLFKLLAVALGLRSERHVILSERGNFPTDLYVAEGLVALLGGRVSLRLVEPGEIAGALRHDVAVVLLTHVNYRTGAMHDMPGLTRAAHQAGALVLWDLAHSAGAVPVDIDGSDADLAVGCGYKFLNGGPGAPAFLYVAERWQQQARFPITGWLGHAEPFGFAEGYRPASGIARATVGTPSILAMVALETGVDIALRAPMDQVRAKSQRASSLLVALAAQQCGGLELLTPTLESARGSQVSFRHPQAGAVMQALIARGVIGDFRPPDILRFGITPLTLRYAELWDAVRALSLLCPRGGTLAVRNA